MYPHILKRSHIRALNDIFDLIKVDRINYLKIDCEGSEYEIFKNFDSYDKIDFIAMELHDFYGFECKRKLIEKMHRTHHIVDFEAVSNDFENFRRQRSQKSQNSQNAILY